MCSASAPTLEVGRGKQHGLSELLRGKMVLRVNPHWIHVYSFMYLFENTFLGVNFCWSLPVSCLCTQTEALLSQSPGHNSKIVPTISFPGVTPAPDSPPKRVLLPRSEFSIKTIPCFLNLDEWGESSECQWCTTCKPHVLLVWSLHVPFNLSFTDLY